MLHSSRAEGSGFGVPSSSSEVIPPPLHSAEGRQEGREEGREAGGRAGREAGKRTGRGAGKGVGRGAARGADRHCGIGDPKNSNQTVICFNSAF